MQKFILLALATAAAGQQQQQQQGGVQPTQPVGDSNPQSDNQQPTDDTQQNSNQPQNTNDDQTPTTGQSDNSNTDNQGGEQDLGELVNQTIEDLKGMTSEEREEFLKQFAENQDFEIDFGFNGGDPQCQETVQDTDEYCSNYSGLSTIAENDDIPTLLTLIQSTCTSDNRTAPNGLGPFLCLGAVGSCQASEFGWSLPQDNSKTSFENFFNKVPLGRMTEYGKQEGKSTLCYKDCRAAWEFWADCGNFQLTKDNDPCDGLPETGCYDPSRPETATLAGASGAGQATIMSGLLLGLVGMMF